MENLRLNLTIKPGLLMTIPLVVLAILSVQVALLNCLKIWDLFICFQDCLKVFFPQYAIEEGSSEFFSRLLSAVISLGGIYLAYLLFYKNSPIARKVQESSRLSDFFYSGWGFDRLYNMLFVKPVVWLSEIDRKDFIDLVYTSVARMTGYFNLLISRTQNGKLRWYVLFLTAGISCIINYYD